MEKLRTYLNSLSKEDKIRFCTACKTTENYLRKATCTKQLLGADLCVAIERESNLKVTRKDLRQKDWLQFWPELAEQEPRKQSEPASHSYARKPIDPKKVMT